jgi:hypothetical protein
LKKKVLLLLVFFGLITYLILGVEYSVALNSKWLHEMEEHDASPVLSIDDRNLSNEMIWEQKSYLKSYLIERSHLRQRMEAENMKLRIHVYVISFLIFAFGVFLTIQAKHRHI